MIHEKIKNTAVSESPALASVVAVIRSSERPTVLPRGNLIEFRTADITNPKRESFESFLLDALNDCAKIASADLGLSVDSSAYVDPAASFGFPLFKAIYLKGENITDQQILRFREAVIVLAHEVLGQVSLFHAEPEPVLEERELNLLKEKALKYRSRHGNSSIKKGFYIHTSFDDREGIAVDGKLPPFQHSAPTNEEIEGVARLDGFSLVNNVISLVPENAGGSPAKSMNFLCGHQKFFETFAEAYMRGCRVRYRGYRLAKAGAKKVILNLTGLELLAANDPDDEFDLE